MWIVPEIHATDESRQGKEEEATQNQGTGSRDSFPLRVLTNRPDSLAYRGQGRIIQLVTVYRMAPMPPRDLF